GQAVGDDDLILKPPGMVERDVEAALAGLHAAAAAAAAAHTDLGPAAARPGAAGAAALDTESDRPAPSLARALFTRRRLSEGPGEVEACAEVLALLAFEIERPGVDAPKVAVEIPLEPVGQGGLEAGGDRREGGDFVVSAAPRPGRTGRQVGVGERAQGAA